MSSDSEALDCDLLDHLMIDALRCQSEHDEEGALKACSVTTVLMMLDSFMDGGTVDRSRGHADWFLLPVNVN
jgi:hypothetical protein